MPKADVRLLEKLRKSAGGDDGVKPPGPAGDGQKAAREVHSDPRYGKDRVFKAQAERAYMAAFA